MKKYRIEHGYGITPYWITTTAMLGTNSSGGVFGQQLGYAHGTKIDGLRGCVAKKYLKIAEAAEKAYQETRGIPPQEFLHYRVVEDI